MAYEIHIRRDSPIDIQEWTELVEASTDIRLNEDDIVVNNPVTGEEIRMARSQGSAEVFFSSNSEWLQVFRFRNGVISFNATADWEKIDGNIRRITFKLATALNAQVLGDEDEEYTKGKSKPWWKLW